MLRKNWVVTPSTAPQRNTRPTCDAMYGHRMNSPDDKPTPAPTMPGPTMRQRLRGASGRSRTTGQEGVGVVNRALLYNAQFPTPNFQLPTGRSTEGGESRQTGMPVRIPPRSLDLPEL